MRKKRFVFCCEFKFDLLDESDESQQSQPQDDITDDKKAREKKIAVSERRDRNVAEKLKARLVCQIKM